MGLVPATILPKMGRSHPNVVTPRHVHVHRIWSGSVAFCWIYSRRLIFRPKSEYNNRLSAYNNREYRDSITWAGQQSTENLALTVTLNNKNAHMLHKCKSVVNIMMNFSNEWMIWPCRVDKIKWGQLTFLPVTKELIYKIKWFLADILCSKKHVTTFLVISWTRTVRLQRFLAYLLLRL